MKVTSIVQEDFKELQIKNGGIHMNKEDLINKVREIKELKLMIEDLEDEIKSIEDEIKAEMVLKGTQEMVVDIFEIRYTPVVSNRFDTKAFKEKYQDLYNQFTKVSESRRFSVL